MGVWFKTCFGTWTMYGSWLSLMRNMFRKHDFTSFIRLHIPYRRSLRFFLIDGEENHSSYFHQMNFVNMHQQIYMNNSINIFSVSKEIQSKAQISLTWMMSIVVCLLISLFQKLTLKFAKEVANLHDMYMPSRILQKDALILLENHKCETCPDLLAVF